MLSGAAWRSRNHSVRRLEELSFESDIRPLFREFDRSEMEWAFDLWSYDDVKENAGGILERLEDGAMPCDDPWPEDRVDVFRRWVQEGMPA
jgi:hypothetical protein